MAGGKKQETVSSQRFSVYLLHPTVKTYREALKEDAHEYDDFREADLERRLPFKGKIFTFRSPPHPPDWAMFLEQGATTPLDGLSLASASALAVIKTPKASYAISFGHGRHLLNPNAIETGFGLKVVLNAVDPDKLRSMDLSNHEVVGRRRRTQTSRGSPIDNFAIDVAQDVLRSVTGEALDASFGRRLVGDDALTMSSTIAFSDLGEKCDAALAKSQETKYRDRFPWVDNLRVVKGVKHAELDQALVEALNGAPDDRVHLAPPGIVDWARLHRFRFTGDGHGARHDEMLLADYLATHPGGVTIENLRSDTVTAFSTDGDAFERWSAYEALVAELALDGETFVLMERRWYRVESTFVAQVDAAIKTIPAKFGLPQATHLEDEPTYNKRICDESSGRFAHLDRQFIPYSGRSKLEPCDVFTDERCFIHVKKGTKSANLSHLFLQGAVSAEAFRGDPDFRAKLKGLLPSSHRKLIPSAQPSPRDYRIVYGIAASAKATLPRSLPFFSRVSLMQCATRLRALDYPVELAHIKIKAAL